MTEKYQCQTSNTICSSHSYFISNFEETEFPSSFFGIRFVPFLDLTFVVLTLLLKQIKLSVTDKMHGTVTDFNSTRLDVRL